MRPSTNVRFDSAAATEAWARALARELDCPAVVLLSGGLGAGKTQITRWCLDELGIADVSSPTFAIHHRYAAGHREVDHVDLYRVKNDLDLEGVGFWDLFDRDDGLVFVEWADRLPPDAWPIAWTRIFVEIAVADNDVREARITKLNANEALEQ